MTCRLREDGSADDLCGIFRPQSGANEGYGKGVQIVAKEIKIWYDREGDYLEVLFERKAGYFRETENDAVMEKVDEEGNVIGFSILKVSAMAEKPLSVSLEGRVA